MSTHQVYVLVDPRSGEIRYVGYCRDLAARLRAHISRAELEGRSDHKSRWVRSILRMGVSPVAKVIKQYDSVMCARTGEQQCEAELRSLGCRLTNTTPTGGLSPMLNADVARKANTAAKATKANASIAQKIATDPEYRDRRLLERRRSIAKARDICRANEKADPKRRADRIARLAAARSKSHESMRHKRAHDPAYRERWLNNLREMSLRGREAIALKRGTNKGVTA